MTIMHGEFSRNAVTVGRALLPRAAAEQGGLLSGKDPTAFNDADPLRLWIIQVGIIIITTQLLSVALRKLRQPKVIAEVLGGILLGPTAFGAIPGFSQHIFPEDGLPFLSLVANIGLCLFLFLVGLEIETATIKQNARFSIAIAVAGITLPFGLGAGIAWPIYKEFIGSDVEFTHFMLFTGVAFCITAFPVLCRILTELKLLDTTVGVIVLSAGVGNDIVGWVLLALSVALVNAGSGLTALYVLLVCVAWTLVMLFPVRWIFAILARKTGSLENGPTIFFMTITILTLFGSAFFTDVIGVHAIFGAFLTGLVVPREGGLTIALTEKLEDMVGIIFLPLYFTLSGLSTNLRLLDSGLIWGYVVAICALAFVGKFGGCTVAARCVGFGWRESSTIGALMSCKGLIELIVLNVGLSAGILTQRVFSMFVLEAVTLTCMTTPLVMYLYPQERRIRVSATGQPFSNVAGETPEISRRESGTSSVDGLGWKRRFTVVLDKIEHLPGMMAFSQIIQVPTIDSSSSEHGGEKSPTPSNGKAREVMIPNRAHRRGPVLDALRLIELNRTSEVMKASVADSLVHTDPLLNIFRMFGSLNGLPVTSSLRIVTYDDLADSVAEHAQSVGSHLVLIPWLPPHAIHQANAEREHNSSTPSAHDTPKVHNPFDALFRSAQTERSANVLHSHFVRGVFAKSTTDVALFVDRSSHSTDIAPAPSTTHHIFFPFFGGPDDRLALEFVVQLCANPNVSATVVRVVKRDVQPLISEEPPSAYLSGSGESHLKAREVNQHTATSGNNTQFPDTVYGAHTTQMVLQSETADTIAWENYSVPASRKGEGVEPELATALARIEFQDLATPVPLHAIVSHGVVNGTHENEHLLVVLGRSRRLAVEDHHSELKELSDERGEHLTSDVRKTIGDVASAFVVTDVRAALIVMQASAAKMGE
ncbi:hypothetical protein PENSPDRAFT_656304 [Peniophora sp. CONT]|nr:hypothetical protein PENSPDRAFT_656304 [Peniophora sp. CONT]